MRCEMLPKLSLAARPPDTRPARQEPRLVPPKAPQPLRRSSNGNPSVVSTTGDDEKQFLMSPAVSPADRPPVAVGRRAAGLVPLFALAGFVALVVSCLAGIGVLHFGSPAKNNITISGREAAGPQADRAPAPIPPEANASQPIATTAIPGVSDAKPPPAHDAAPQPRVAQTPPPASPSSKPPTPAVLTPGDGAGSSNSATAATEIAAQPPTQTNAKNAAAAHHTVSLPTGYHRPPHARAEPRHAHLRAAHKDRSPAPQSPAAQPSTSGQRDQAASFDRLVTQLTEPAKHTDQSLTPPPTGAPDPFARPASGE